MRLRPLIPLVAALLGACSASTAPGADLSAALDLATPPDLAPLSPCAQLTLPVRAFNPGPYGMNRGDAADDFTVIDQNGNWGFKAGWSGCESYVFIPDSWVVSPIDSTPLWTADLDGLLAASAPNVHYFFVSRKASGDGVAASLALIAAQLDGVLGALPAGSGPGQQDWWRARIHLVQTSSRAIDGWLGQALTVTAASSPLGQGFAIDRFGRLRGLGSLADVNRFDANLQSQGQWPWQNNLAYAANPPLYFNYESDRQDALDAEKSPTVVKLLDKVAGGGLTADVMLPDATAMAGFDTLEIDADQDCTKNTVSEENGNCPAWDYISSINFTDETDPMTTHEAGRFITTYHRAGRYLVDASHMLPYLAKGGLHHVDYGSANTYLNSLSLRFSRRNPTGPRPVQTTFLYTGGNFDTSYNTNHMTPVNVPIPVGAKKVELRAILTGHGDVAPDNCSEFCDHQHEFTVGGKVHLKDFPEVGDQQGCMKKIGMGQVPNQSGTWWFGRGGWCPGMQVDPWIVDVTADATPGQMLTVSYRALYGGKPTTMGRGNIVLSAWIVVWQ